MSHKQAVSRLNPTLLLLLLLFLQWRFGEKLLSIWCTRGLSAHSLKHAALSRITEQRLAGITAVTSTAAVRLERAKVNS